MIRQARLATSEGTLTLDISDLDPDLRADETLWMHLRVGVEAEHFSWNFPAALMEGDIDDLVGEWDRERQERSGRKDIWFVPMEPWLVLHISDGQIQESRVDVRIMEVLGLGAVLSFSGECDNAEVDGFIEALRGSLEARKRRTA